MIESYCAETGHAWDQVFAPQIYQAIIENPETEYLFEGFDPDKSGFL